VTKATRRLVGLAAAGCTTLGLAGCGSSSSTSTAAGATPSATATATAAPTPTADLTAAAKTAYLAAATTSNTSIDAKQLKALCKSTRIADIKSCWAQNFAIGEQFLTAVTAITFPDSMKADVSALISNDTKTAQLENTLSQQDDPNADTLDYTAWSTASNDGTAAAGVVRHDLGLPPVPPV
jgi:hypothetical protein